MKKNKLHIALVQSKLVWEQPNKNRLLFTKQIEAIVQPIDLIVLPEMFTTGFTMNTSLAETMQGETIMWMQELAVVKNVAITGSIIIKEDGKYYNRLLFVHPNGNIEYYNKHHLFTLSGEDKVFTAGKEQVTIKYKGWKIHPLICYDLRFPEWSRNTYNYDVLLYVASWPQKRITAWKTLLKARAIENMSYTIGVNRVGVDGNAYKYSGNSMAVATLGEVLTNFKDDVSEIKIVTLDKQKQDSLRETFGFLNDITFDTPFLK